MLTAPFIPVVIPAAGIGSRMGSHKAKQYLSLCGKSILEHTLDIFVKHSSISEVVVVLNPNDTEFCHLPIAQNSKVSTVVGGDERVDSVLAGLEYLHNKQTFEHVMVHDAARPCLHQDDLETLLQNRAHKSGAILATRVVDTIKQATSELTSISSTIDRSLLWHAQTPQLFPLALLIEAIKHAQQNGIAITDESSAAEYSGIEVNLVEGRSSNIKITRPEDLSLAEFYLQKLN